jgi:hypothetical protein
MNKLLVVVVATIVVGGGAFFLTRDNKNISSSNSNTTANDTEQSQAPVASDEKLYEESEYVGFDACEIFKTALSEVFPGETLTTRDPYKNFNATGEWINGCTVEGADPFGFSNVLTVRTYTDSSRASERLLPVDELPNGSGFEPGTAVEYGDGATVQNTSTFGYESTFMRYVTGTHYIELQVGGAVGIRDNIKDVALELDMLIPAY